MRQQHDPLGNRRQLIKRAHRHIDFVADATDVDQQRRRILFQQPAFETTDHRPPAARAAQARREAPPIPAAAQTLVPARRHRRQQRARMRMADRARKRIGRIGRGDAVEREQALHHQLHLALVGLAKADDRLLDPQRGVLVHDQALADRRADRRAARLTEQQGRLGIHVDEHLLDRRHMRPRVADHVAERAAGSCRGVRAVHPAARGSRLRHIGPSRVPLTSITPYPVRLRPGSMPRMRRDGGTRGLCHAGCSMPARPAALARLSVRVRDHRVAFRAAAASYFLCLRQRKSPKKGDLRRGQPLRAALVLLGVSGPGLRNSLPAVAQTRSPARPRCRPAPLRRPRAGRLQRACRHGVTRRG